MANDSDWTTRLRLQDDVDVLDTVRIWCEAVVIGLTPRKVFVHYRSWPVAFDEWIPLTSSRLAPAYSRVLNWRVELAIGQRVQHMRLGRTTNEKARVWRNATVCATRLDDKNVRHVQLEIDGEKETLWVDVMSEMLSAPGKHKVLPSPREQIEQEGGADATSCTSEDDESSSSSESEDDDLVVVTDVPTCECALPTDGRDQAQQETTPVMSQAVAPGNSSTGDLAALFEEWARHTIWLNFYGGQDLGRHAIQLHNALRECMGLVVNGGDQAMQRRDELKNEVEETVDAITRLNPSTMVSFRARSIALAVEAIVDIVRE